MARRNPAVASARFSAAELDRLDRMCAARGLTRSEIVRRSIVQTLRAGSPAPTRGEARLAAGMTPAQRVRFLSLRAARTGAGPGAALAAAASAAASPDLLAAVIDALPEAAALDVLRRVLRALGVDPDAPPPAPPDDAADRTGAALLAEARRRGGLTRRALDTIARLASKEPNHAS